MVRLEFQRTSLLSNIMKRSLTWIAKVLSMDDARYPKQCLNRLIAKCDKDRANKTPNWILSITNSLKEMGFEVLPSNLNTTFLMENLDDILTRIDTNSRKEDLRRADLTSYSNWYSSPVSDYNYLHLGMKMAKLSLFCQVRTAREKISRLRWKGVTTLFDPNETCPHCNTGLPDSIVHFMTSCPAFQPQRSHHLGNYTGFVEIVNANTIQSINNIFIFVVSALKLRNFDLQE